VGFGLEFTKKDAVTMILLSTVFFSMAIWNVGLVNAPVSNWQSTQTQIFYIDLGSEQQVQTVYFWVKQGNASVEVSSGAPNQWTYVGQFKLENRDTDYMTWHSTTLNTNTRYLHFNVTPTIYDSRPQFYWIVPTPTDREPSPFVDVLEIGVSNLNNQQIQIISITNENNTDPTLSMLVDEQNSLEFPPTYMSKMYFDEVYFARSAVQFVNHEIPYERTHPDLGKVIQSIGVAVFGATPFGWRIIGVVFGTLIVPLMYLLGKKLFHSWIGGFTASFLMTFDFMHFTMARIGTVDTYVIFFSLLCQIAFLIYFFNVLKKGWRKSSILPLFLAIFFFALAFSTKFGFPLWSALGLLALLAAIRFKDLLKLKGSLADKYVAFFDYPFLILLFGSLGIVTAVYFAAYIPRMLAGESFMSIINLQSAMLSFHSGTVTDPASSPWWSWPTMFNPGGSAARWFDISYFPPNNNPISTIYVLGNPAIWWVGFALIILLAVKAFHINQIAAYLRNRLSKAPIEQHVSIRGNGWNPVALYIVTVFIFSWLIYVIVGRATYIYHFYLSVPLIILAITYFINKYWNTKFGKAAAISVFAASIGMFVLFYPVISGAPIEGSYIHNYLNWFPSRFYAP
jgi:dolichyl-phosphate-mannose-protein mannosyltransferase